MNDKIVLEYSNKQKCYHIQTLQQRNSKPINGYRLFGIFDSYDEAYQELSKRKEKK